MARNDPNEAERIRQLVREIGQAGGLRTVPLEEIDGLRDFFGRRVLRDEVDSYIIDKHSRHVEDDEQWPIDTTPDE